MRTALTSNGVERDTVTAAACISPYWQDCASLVRPNLWVPNRVGNSSNVAAVSVTLMTSRQQPIIAAGASGRLRPARAVLLLPRRSA